jgi:hypothetical protein
MADMTQTTEPTPLTPHELADCFRRLALLTNDDELAERMRRHADETEREASGNPKKVARH